jgi:peptidoglycan/xylan/chitin deacetylase (PgdA/CDA1 family)
MTNITIVMYHYVREIQNSPYSNIKGLEFEGFKRQLDYIENNFTIISPQQLIDYKYNNQMPNNACLLTFDDGYKDHIVYVMPELLNRNLQGAFFPPVKPVVEREPLDVNRIHFILACCRDFQILVKKLNELCCENNITTNLLSEYWRLYGVSSRYDIPEVMYVKHMLQHALPEDIRNSITKTLFEAYVGKDQSTFADELYLSIDDTKKLVQEGMYVGSHGYSHLWLNKEKKSSQENEINISLSFLNTIGAQTKDWIMCYPYGAYNEDTLKIIEQKECAIGLTTKVGIAELDKTNLLELPRFDTNDFPK